MTQAPSRTLSLCFDLIPLQSAAVQFKVSAVQTARQRRREGHRSSGEDSSGDEAPKLYALMPRLSRLDAVPMSPPALRAGNRASA